MRTVNKRRKLKQAKRADKPEPKWQEVWMGCSGVIPRDRRYLPADRQALTHCVLKAELGKPVFLPVLGQLTDRKEDLWECG